MNEFGELIDETIRDVYINADHTSLVVETESNKFFLFETEADCCSDTWIEHVTLPAWQKEIQEVKRVDLGEVMPTRQECDKLYGLYIGQLAVEFRNSSNGYYGGWISLRDTRNNLPPGFTKLEEDL